jgi:dTDP-3-amino-3,4,6-trideoxy-alpha-D-glucose transaminase
VIREPETIPANPFDRQWAAIGPDVMQAVERVGASGRYVLGQEVESFERAFAAHSGVAHAVGCGSGLDAIEIGLRALGLAPGDRVLTTPLSAFATSLAILRAGGVPCFVDVDDSGLLDLDEAEKRLAQDSAIRFLVPVHLFGHALDLERLTELRDRFELRIVEDAAQAALARSGGRAVGSVGQAAAVSFYPTKNLGALGDGGCVLTDDRRIADDCRAIRDYGQSTKYVHDRLGMNSRLDELHAAVLSSAMLPRLSDWTTRRREIAARYVRGLAGAPVDVPPIPERSESVWHLFPVLVREGDRDDLLEHLGSNGVQAGIHYPRLISEQPALPVRPDRGVGSLANARRFRANEVSLPIHPYLRDDEIDRVVALVREWKP